MKLSAVVLNRNDDYKEPKRAAFCVNSLLDTFDEVVYVDYNSPDDKGSSLNTFIDDIPKTGKLKHIVIPPYAHNLMTNITGGDDVQVCTEVVGKNIGIRRATGDWIVSTNIDIIGPERNTFRELVPTLSNNNFYIVSRRDVDLQKCMSYDVKDWKQLHKELCEITRERHMCGAKLRGVKPLDDCPNVREKGDGRCWGGGTCEYEVKYPWGCTPNDVWSKINCCGDWQFAHRDIWYNIRAYEEFMMGKCFTDTNIQKKAEIYGYPVEVIYDLPLFHIEHKPSAGTGGGKGGTENNPLMWVDQFNQQSLNQTTWGFSQIAFEEEII